MAAAGNWFVALPVPAGAWLDELPPPPPAVRLFAAGDLHLTVAFLGRVSPERAQAAFACAAALPLGPLEISFARVAALGGRRPSAFSALLDRGRDQVERAIAAVRDRMCDAAGAARDTRPPLAHMTLARPKRAATPAELRAAEAWAASLALSGVRAQLSRVALYTWSADRESALFRIESELALALRSHHAGGV